MRDTYGGIDSEPQTQARRITDASAAPGNPLAGARDSDWVLRPCWRPFFVIQSKWSADSVTDPLAQARQRKYRPSPIIGAEINACGRRSLFATGWSFAPAVALVGNAVAVAIERTFKPGDSGGGVVVAKVALIEDAVAVAVGQAWFTRSAAV